MFTICQTYQTRFPSEETIQIVIIEDHTLLRESIASILYSEPGFEVIGQGSTAEDAIWLAHELQPDVILLDMDLPVNGIAINHAINLHSPETNFVYLTVSDLDDRPVRTISSGGRAFILKNIGSQELFRILRTVYFGKSFFPAAMAAEILAEWKSGGSEDQEQPALEMPTSFSDLEGKILGDLASGLNSQGISQKLNISRRMVNRSLASIIEKLQLRTRSARTATRSYDGRTSPKSYLAIEIGKK